MSSGSRARAHERREHFDGRTKRLDGEHLAADVRVQPDELDGRGCAGPVDGPLRVACREAEPELRVVLPGLHVFVRVGLDAGSDPEEHRRSETVLRMQRVEAIELVERVDDGATHARGASRPQLDEALVVAVKDEPLGGKPAASATCSSPPVATSRRNPSSSTKRTIARHKNAFEA